MYDAPVFADVAADARMPGTVTGSPFLVAQKDAPKVNPWPGNRVEHLRFLSAGENSRKEARWSLRLLSGEALSNFQHVRGL
jgi:hypothetical protein